MNSRNWQQVAIAIIEREYRMVVQQRKTGDSLDGLWEFPGGKIEADETPERCVVRECLEELAITVEPVGRLEIVTFQYNECNVVIHPMRCLLRAGEPRPNRPEIGAVLWVTMRELNELPMPPANKPIIEALISMR